MINVENFYKTLIENDFDFFTGVPDSLLKSFCAYLTNNRIKKHIVAANEGNAVAIASGYNIATGKYGVLYMQNSGIGNTVNPLLSLSDEGVYKIPMLFVIGYRGEPGIKDEPQHIKQGKLTLPLLETIGINYLILDEDYKNKIEYCKKYIQETNKSIALIVRKDTFNNIEYETKQNEINDYDTSNSKSNSFDLSREDALEVIIDNLTSNEYIVSTTGKTSREIFEIRQKNNMKHDHDFLTVGSMGHASSLALGISNNCDKKIYCIDGDGAFIMHMGALPIAIQNTNNNFKYILINNGCHESVGGQPTVINRINLVKVFEGFGFKQVYNVYNKEDLKEALLKQKDLDKCAIIINTNSKSRKDLGRPTISPIENKDRFQKNIRS